MPGMKVAPSEAGKYGKKVTPRQAAQRTVLKEREPEKPQAPVVNVDLSALEKLIAANTAALEKLIAVEEKELKLEMNPTINVPEQEKESPRNYNIILTRDSQGRVASMQVECYDD